LAEVMVGMVGLPLHTDAKQELSWCSTDMCFGLCFRFSEEP